MQSAYFSLFEDKMIRVIQHDKVNFDKSIMHAYGVMTTYLYAYQDPVITSTHFEENDLTRLKSVKCTEKAVRVEDDPNCLSDDSMFEVPTRVCRGLISKRTPDAKTQFKHANTCYQNIEKTPTFFPFFPAQRIEDFLLLFEEGCYYDVQTVDGMYQVQGCSDHTLCVLKDQPTLEHIERGRRATTFGEQSGSVIQLADVVAFRGPCILTDFTHHKLKRNIADNPRAVQSAVSCYALEQRLIPIFACVQDAYVMRVENGMLVWEDDMKDALILEVKDEDVEKYSISKYYYNIDMVPDAKPHCGLSVLLKTRLNMRTPKVMNTTIYDATQLGLKFALGYQRFFFQQDVPEDARRLDTKFTHGICYEVDGQKRYALKIYASPTQCSVEHGRTIKVLGKVGDSHVLVQFVDSGALFHFPFLSQDFPVSLNSFPELKDECDFDTLYRYEDGLVFTIDVHKALARLQDDMEKVFAIASMAYDPVSVTVRKQDMHAVLDAHQKYLNTPAPPDPLALVKHTFDRALNQRIVWSFV